MYSDKIVYSEHEVSNPWFSRLVTKIRIQLLSTFYIFFILTLVAVLSYHLGYRLIYKVYPDTFYMKPWVSNALLVLLGAIICCMMVCYIKIDDIMACSFGRGLYTILLISEGVCLGAVVYRYWLGMYLSKRESENRIINLY
jgi:hypothetical protein